jgi:hypothetical protein
VGPDYSGSKIFERRLMSPKHFWDKIFLLISRYFAEEIFPGEKTCRLHTSSLRAITLWRKDTESEKNFVEHRVEPTRKRILS